MLRDALVRDYPSVIVMSYRPPDRWLVVLVMGGITAFGVTSLPYAKNAWDVFGWFVITAPWVWIGVRALVARVVVEGDQVTISGLLRTRRLPVESVACFDYRLLYEFAAWRGIVALSPAGEIVARSMVLAPWTGNAERGEAVAQHLTELLKQAGARSPAPD